MDKKILVVILGPTAAGKTRVAIDLARELGTEIISADSRQFFREMEIGTAKPDKQELLSVKHHFINSLSVEDNYNVGRFEEDALKILDSIFRESNTAIMAGGSGLYINAVCNGFDEMPETDEAIRSGITEKYKQEGITYLQNTLRELDEEHYNKADLKNPHRLIRAIEVCLTTGKKYSELREGKKQKRNFIPVKIGLHTAREKLYDRINARVDEMMGSGLLEEVKSLLKYKNRNALQTVGYKELFGHLEGKISLEKAVDQIKQNTRNFAKRQMTWFRKDQEIKWFEAGEIESMLDYIKDARLKK